MNTKLVFVDESGDTGNKTNSSKYFVICFVIFEDFLEAEKLSLELKKLRRERFKNDYQEFHFTKDSVTTKKKFFEITKQGKFFVKAYILDKSKIKENTKENFYKKYLLESVSVFIKSFDNSRIQIDGKGSKIYNRSIFTYINKISKDNNVNVKSVKFADSKTDMLIQLADMCAGCIRRSFENSNKDIDKIYKLIQSKVDIFIEK